MSEPLDEPLPVALLLGDLAPRRGAFGQRRESALELFEPAPREPARLTLTAPNGEAVGEIVLHDVMAAPRRRPFESPQHETPFFPEDLQDAPSRRLARKVLAPAKAKPSREVVATVLLAGLAARLAHEEAALQALIGAYAANSIAA